MPQKDLNEMINSIPSLDNLAGRFLFIDDDLLRDNITIAFQYIIFLITIQADTLQGPIVYSIFKDIMVYTGSVVESCLHYCVQEYLKADLIDKDKVLSWEWKEEKHIPIYEIEDNREVCAVVRFKKCKDFDNKIQFAEMNKIAYKSGILTKELYDMAERIREDRNKVHLVALDKTPDYFSKENVEASFKRAKEIIERIEQKLLDLKNI